MEQNEKLRALETLQKKLYAYNCASNSLYLDAVTVAPKNTAEGRGVALSILAGELQKLMTAPETLALVEELYARRETLDTLHRREVEELRRSCPEALFTLLMRRLMMRISEQVAKRIGAHGLVTGESLGQVASQTMEAMAVTGQVCTLPVFRPVIGMDKEEIIRIARKIGTFETSILPYEDCCTVFTPRHPKTRPTLEEIQEAEAALDIDALVQKAVDGIERVVLTP